jgi:hypothetical protein
MPDVHVVRNSVVIGSRLHEVLVVVSLKMMRMEPHAHMHGVELGWKAAAGRVGQKTALPCGRELGIRRLSCWGSAYRGGAAVARVQNAVFGTVAAWRARDFPLPKSRP